MIDPMEHNYMSKVLDLAALTTPGLHIVSVAHDDWCPKLTENGICTCDPDVSMSDDHPGAA